MPLCLAAHAVTEWFRHREMGLSMGIYHTAMPLGTILSLNFVGIAAFRFGWRAPIWSIFVLCALSYLLFLFLYRETDGDQRMKHQQHE